MLTDIINRKISKLSPLKGSNLGILEMNVQTYSKKYDYFHIETGYEKNSGGKKKHGSKREESEENTLSLKNVTTKTEKAKTASSSSTISRNEVEHILYLSSNKGVRLRAISDYLGYYINKKV